VGMFGMIDEASPSRACGLASAQAPLPSASRYISAKSPL
jgi:hypothetical protein